MEIASLRWEYGRNWKGEACDQIFSVGRGRLLDPQLDFPRLAFHDSELYGSYHVADTSLIFHGRTLLAFTALGSARCYQFTDGETEGWRDASSLPTVTLLERQESQWYA